MEQGPLTTRVIGTGSFLPERSMDNQELYRMESIRANFDVERARGSLKDSGGVEDLPPGEVFDRWARQVTGIRRRRVQERSSGVSTEEMAARAGRRALDDAGMEPADLDMIVVATVSPSDEVPNAAVTVADRLGIPEVAGFTLNTACAGFVYAMGVSHSLVLSGQAENVLVLAADTLTRITDYSDPKTAVLFGDGAGGAVLAPSDGSSGILGRPCLESEYAREHLYLIGQAWLPENSGPEALRMEGGARVLRKAIHAMADVADGALATTDRSWADVDFVIPHQANLRITQGLEKQLPLESGRVIHTIEEYGNSSASTVSIAFDEVLRGEHGPVPDPACFVLTAVGGGYSSAALALDWSPDGGK